MTTPTPHARLWRLLRAGSAAVAVVVVGAGVAHAGVRTVHAAGHPVVPAAKTSAFPTTPIPTSGPGVLPGYHSYNRAFVAEGTTENLAGKAATVLTLPTIPLYLYPVDFTDAKNYQYTPAWVVSNALTPQNPVPPTAIQYGQFPPIRFSTLAFGAIPLSATVRVSQIVGPDGKYEPIVARQSPVLDGAYYWFTVGGRLTVQLSDVVVDGVPLELSPSCRTVTPAVLTAHARGYPGGSPSDPDYYNATFGGHLVGNIVVPAFTGCTARPAGGAIQNLDALLGGTVSGSSNATFVGQADAFGYYAPTREYACYNSQNIVCGTPPPVPIITGPTTAPPLATPSNYPPTPTPSVFPPPLGVP